MEGEDHPGLNGAFSPDHITMRCLWRVLKRFTAHEREKFLRFVTSHSRAPLRGFKDLEPLFTIQNTGEGKYLKIFFYLLALGCTEKNLLKKVV